LDFFHSIDGLRVVHLRRRNVVKRYLSWLALSQTGVAVVRGDEGRRNEKVLVDLDNLIAGLDTIQGQDDAAAAIVASHPSNLVFPIIYEEYFASEDAQAETNRQMFEFLGAEPLDQTPIAHKKILSNKIDQIVENSEAFCERLRGTRYEQWL